MDFVTMKEFADQKGVTYEAIRRQVANYSDELRGHIVTRDRTKYLDEYAQEFLSERRRLSPVVTKIEENRDAVKELEATVEDLRARLALAREELLSSQQKVIQLQDEKAGMIEAKSRYEALLEDHETMKQRLSESEEREAAARSDLEQIREESAEKDQALADLRREASEQAGKLAQVEHDLEEARKEADSYTRSWFGFYRKK